jgi:hypothetical protein
MKTSNKCLSILIVALFLGTALLIIVERMLLGHEPAIVAAKVADAEKTQAWDSSLAVVPGDGVVWNRVTLGLRRSFRRGIIEDSSIFKDMRLTFMDSWCWTGFFKPLNRSTFGWFGLRYKKTDSDSLKPADSEGYVNDCIYIHIIKYKENRPSYEVDAYKKNILKAMESPHGVWNYWNYQSAWCEWRKGRWFSQIEVTLKSCGNDSAKTLELRDQIRDRLFAYYKILK